MKFKVIWKSRFNHFDILISDDNDDVETLTSDTTNDVKLCHP